MQIFKYFLRYMNTRKALSRWTVFYVGLLIVSVIYNSIYTFQFYDFSDLFTLLSRLEIIGLKKARIP